MHLAPTRDKAANAFNHFVTVFQAKYPKAMDCLVKDRDRLFTFHDFPAEQWIHFCSINAIESTFATVCLRTSRNQGCRLSDPRPHSWYSSSLYKLRSAGTGSRDTTSSHWSSKVPVSSMGRPIRQLDQLAAGYV